MRLRIAGRPASIIAMLALALPALAVTSSAPAPDFRLKTSDGKQFSMTEHKGEVVMINFWASWCGPCRQEMPLLDSIYKKYGKLGFTLVGVNVEPDQAAADAWLKKTPVSFPILYDPDSKVSKLYGVQGMPNTVFVDRKGQVRKIHRGYKPGDENQYLDQIRQLVRE
jgi:thiol-disulfide isomerase/thioredoxin